MTSFNDGIEAAALWMDELARQAKTVAGLSEYAENCRTIAQNIRALKRPEPSEDDVLKAAQAIRQQIPDAEPIAIEAAARAALKAMRPTLEPTEEMVTAALNSKARDDEGEFQSLSDLLDFSGENKARSVAREAIRAALKAMEVE